MYAFFNATCVKHILHSFYLNFWITFLRKLFLLFDEGLVRFNFFGLMFFCYLSITYFVGTLFCGKWMQIVPSMGSASRPLTTLKPQHCATLLAKLSTLTWGKCAPPPLRVPRPLWRRILSIAMLAFLLYCRSTKLLLSSSESFNCQRQRHYGILEVDSRFFCRCRRV